MKYVIVTGAFGGMGKAVVNKLVEEGFFVFALDRKTCDGFCHPNVLAIEVDLTDENSVLKAFEKVKSVTDNLFAILHFAGIYMLDSLVEIEDDKFQKIFDVNVFGAYRVNKAFLSLLGKGSRIVIATSELAPLNPLPFTGIYAITKSALSKYAYSLRMELQLLGIKVVELRPGAVKTDMLGASTTALDKFCDTTRLYKCNSKRFKNIVERVEAKNIEPQKIAIKTAKILSKKNPKLVYKINRNKLLLLLNVLPKKAQTKIIKKVLREKNQS